MHKQFLAKVVDQISWQNQHIRGNLNSTSQFIHRSASPDHIYADMSLGQNSPQQHPKSKTTKQNILPYKIVSIV